MPEISKEFLDKIEKCLWLKNCGTEQQLEYKFDIERVTGISKIKKNISSTKWENISLEKQGDLTSYLTINHKQEYTQSWNKQVRFVKEEYIPALQEKVRAALVEKQLPDGILDDVKFNLVMLYMAEYYSEYYHVEFFENMLEVYLSGHLPCGWSGSSKDGKMMVY